MEKTTPDKPKRKIQRKRPLRVARTAGIRKLLESPRLPLAELLAVLSLVTLRRETVTVRLALEDVPVALNILRDIAAQWEQLERPGMASGTIDLVISPPPIVPDKDDYWDLFFDDLEDELAP